MTETSVSDWIVQLKTGDEAAAQHIWRRFFPRLCGYVRQKLSPSVLRTHDDEDFALSALNALCQGARGGHFRQLENRQDLWQILMMISARKAANAFRRPSVRHEIGECDMPPNAVGSWSLQGLEDFAALPEFVDSVDVCGEELLAMLPDKLRDVALLKLYGHTNAEIARLKGRGLSTVERYLQMIREKWDSVD